MPIRKGEDEEAFERRMVDEFESVDITKGPFGIYKMRVEDALKVGCMVEGCDGPTCAIINRTLGGDDEEYIVLCLEHILGASIIGLYG